MLRRHFPIDSRSTLRAEKPIVGNFSIAIRTFHKTTVKDMRSDGSDGSDISDGSDGSDGSDKSDEADEADGADENGEPS